MEITIRYEFLDVEDELCKSKSGNCTTTHDTKIQHVGSSNIDVNVKPKRGDLRYPLQEVGVKNSFKLADLEEAVECAKDGAAKRKDITTNKHISKGLILGEDKRTDTHN